MASACRSATAVMGGARSLARILSAKPIPASPFASSTRPIARSASRVSAAMGSVESLLPLHSAIASARLRSSIAVDSSCWSWLSQGSCVKLGKPAPNTRVRKPYLSLVEN